MTVHRGPVRAIDRFRAGVSGDSSLGVLDAGDLLSGLVDEVIAGYYGLAEGLELEIDRLDQLALRGGRVDILAALVDMRRRIGLIRRVLTPHRGALAALARPEMRAESDIGRPWPGLVDRLEGAIAAYDGLRDALLGTYDIHMGRAAQRANDVMKALTLLSALLLPAVVLAGIMGMNFKLAFFDEPTQLLRGRRGDGRVRGLAARRRALAPLAVGRRSVGDCAGGLGGVRERTLGFRDGGFVRALDGGRVLGHGGLPRLQPREDDLDGGGDRHGQEGPDEATDGGPDQQADEDEQRRDADGVAHHQRDEDAALDELEDDVHAGDHDGELR